MTFIKIINITLLKVAAFTKMKFAVFTKRQSNNLLEEYISNLSKYIRIIDHKCDFIQFKSTNYYKK